MDFNEWEGFNEGSWKNEINVRDFIQKNYTPYHGDDRFLEKASKRCAKIIKEFLS